MSDEEGKEGQLVENSAEIEQLLTGLGSLIAPLALQQGETQKQQIEAARATEKQRIEASLESLRITTTASDKAASRTFIQSMLIIIPAFTAVGTLLYFKEFDYAMNALFYIFGAYSGHKLHTSQKQGKEEAT